MDNELDIIIVVAFQKILKLSYLDKFLDDIHLAFRDRYKNEIMDRTLVGKEGIFGKNIDFTEEYHKILAVAEKWGREQTKLPKQMKSFEDSMKSKKTVASMIESKSGSKPSAPSQAKKNVKIVEDESVKNGVPLSPSRADIIAENRRKMMEKMTNKKSPKESSKKESTPKSKGKAARVWDLSGTTKDMPNLDRSKDKPEDMQSNFTHQNDMVGTVKGGIQDLEVESESEYEEEDESSEDEG